jgi:hypothetical protein
MTIHQLPDRCWELQPPTDDERGTHYDTEAAALRGLKEDRENDEKPYAETKPVQLPAGCWAVQCDGECGTVLDEEDEGYVFHHDSRTKAEQTAAGYDWAFDGDGRVFCEEDAPADAVALPTPAELEAAGQLVLPGVLP